MVNKFLISSDIRRELKVGLPKDELDLLLRAKWIFPVDGISESIQNGEVAVKDGKIVYVGTKMPDHWQAKNVVEMPSSALLPGFVNSHCHAASTVFRAQSEDGEGGRALYTVAFRGEGIVEPEDWAIMAKLGVLEMAKAGITTLNDFWYAPDDMGEAALATGLRMQLATEILDVDKNLVPDGDYTRDSSIAERTLRNGVEVASRWHGRNNGLITSRLGPHAIDTVSEGLFKECVHEARANGWGLHTHAAQSPQEVNYIREKTGLGPVTWLGRLELLGPDWVLAHLTFAEELDLKIAFEHDVGYAHAASIYPRRGVYPDLSGAKSKGIRTGMASDWLLNDPFEIMRVMLSATRLKAGDYKALSSYEALELATAGAADVVGLGDCIGRLKVGYDADIIAVALDRPHMQPFYGTATSLVWHARASDVTDSWVKGKPVLAKGEVDGIDESDALNAFATRLNHLGEMIRGLGGITRTDPCQCCA